MGLLDRITGPRDLRDLSAAELDELAQEIRDFLVRKVSRTGGHLGPNLGVVELTLALHRVFDSPVGPDRLRHRPPVLRAQDRHRSRRRLRQAPAGGRPLRLPQPRRVRARRRRELPRLDRAVVRRRARQGVLDPRREAARRRRDRGRCAHRRDGLGGAEQHRRRRRQRRPPAGDRGQRQRPLLHPDRRRSRQPPHRAAHQPPLRAGPRPGQAPAERRPRRRPRRVRRPARDEEGHEGRPRPAGPVRGPRPEVRRTRRRPRPGRGRARPHPGQEVRGPGDRARDHPQGPRLRPGGAARGRPVPRPGPVQRRDRRGEPQGPDLDRRVRRGDPRPRRASGPTWSRSPPR